MWFPALFGRRRLSDPTWFNYTPHINSNNNRDDNNSDSGGGDCDDGKEAKVNN